MDSTNSINDLDKKWLRPDARQDDLQYPFYSEYAGSRLSRLQGFQQFNSAKPDYTSQGLLTCLQDLQQALCELTAFEALSLAVRSNAQAVFSCLAMLRKYHLRKKQPRNVLLCLPGVSTDIARKAENMRYEILTADIRYLDKAINDELAAIVIPLNLLQGHLISPQQIKLLKLMDVLIYVDGHEQGLIPQYSSMGDWGVDLMHLDIGHLCQVYPGSGVVLSGAALKDYLPTPGIAQDEDRLQWTKLNKNPLSIGPISESAVNIDVLLRCYVAIKLRACDGLQQQALLDMVYMASLVKALNAQESYTGYVCIPVSTVLRLQINNDTQTQQKLQPFLRHVQTLNIPVQGEDYQDKSVFVLTLRWLHRLPQQKLKWMTQLLLDVGARVLLPGLTGEHK